MNTDVFVNFMIFIIGVVILFLGQASFMSETYKNVFLGIGCSVIASAIVAYLNYIYSKASFYAKNIKGKLGLESYDSLEPEKPEYSGFEEDIIKTTKQIDLMGYFFKALRYKHSDLIKDKVRSGLQVRFLAVNPGCISMKEMEETRLGMDSMELDAWVKELKNIAPAKEKVQLRFINHEIQNTYIRSDDHIYVTPFAHMTNMPRLTYKFSENTEGFLCYADIFEKTWNEACLRE